MAECTLKRFFRMDHQMGQRIPTLALYVVHLASMTCELLKVVNLCPRDKLIPDCLLLAMPGVGVSVQTVAILGHGGSQRARTTRLIGKGWAPHPPDPCARDSHLAQTW